MQPRTIRGLKEFREEKDSDNNKKLDSLFDEIAEKLYYYVFDKTEKPIKRQEDFDNWHKTICEDFVKKFNDLTGNSVDTIYFGKGQKLINCSLKYIYCLKGAGEEKYKEKFEYCHMILDRYTYSEGFYNKEVIAWYNAKNQKDQKKNFQTIVVC